jgi:hypothetical protein
MTTNQIQREYLKYLESQVKTPRRGTYHDLFSVMHDKEFVWIVPNDDNRVADGRDVRFDWAEENGVGAVDANASFLEVLIGISRRLGFLTAESSEGWAWQLIVNLELDNMTDRLLNYGEEKVDEILETCIWRQYDQFGRGGFFPLNRPKQDQREVEIWYQMNAYVIEIEQ